MPNKIKSAKIKKRNLTKEEISWIFYDWANSSYILIVVTAVFPIFFKKIIASGISDNISSAYLGYTSTIYALIIALLSPIFGTIADYKGYKKKFLAFFWFIGILFTLLLTIVQKSNINLCLIIFMLSSIGYAGANIFYDSFITDITDEKKVHWISSLGFAFGYLGSSVPYIISITAIKFLPKLFGEEFIENSIRISFLITALWWFVFSIPLLKNVKQKYFIAKSLNPIKDSFLRLFNTLKEIKKYKFAFLFLLSYFLYIDGVDTIIKMAVPYALDINIRLDVNSLLLILLVIQLIAFPFAIIFGYFAKKNPDKIIFILIFSIFIYIFIVIFAFYIKTIAHFWILSIMVAFSQGAVQSLSRSYYSLIIPKEKSAEFFGFYNIFGKFAAILGPFIVGIISYYKNIRFGVIAILPLFIAGIFMLLFQLKNKISSKKP
ncbi:MAG: MFS transporter [Spirochaetes bacterium]|nr:MFS transporter [Spirochaetota bacterium]